MQVPVMICAELPLSLSLDAAREVVADSVRDVRAIRNGDTISYKTNTGTTVAILRATPDAKNSASQLRYRTTMLSPTMARARRKASEIRDALGEYRA